MSDASGFCIGGEKSAHAKCARRCGTNDLRPDPGSSPVWVRAYEREPCARGRASCAALQLDRDTRMSASVPSAGRARCPLKTIAGVAGEMAFNWSTRRLPSAFGIGRSAKTRSIPPPSSPSPPGRGLSKPPRDSREFRASLCGWRESVHLRRRRGSCALVSFAYPQQVHGNTCPNAPEQACGRQRAAVT